MSKIIHYQTPKTGKGFRSLPDATAFIIILGVLAALAYAANRISVPYQIGQPILISLDPIHLPGYAANTVLRMLIALSFSFIFTLIVAPLAAKNRQAEKLLLPLIDILQSIPILGILSITVVAFIQLFPNSLWGPECAAIFAIFTSQVWNMTLSFYQSLRTIPIEFYDTSAIFHLSKWQQFWRIEVPYAAPGLIWNAMVSMSAGWFFVVASEAISVSNQEVLLPGIGSYIRVAIDNANLTAIFYAISTMFLVILIYDQLLFRPLLTWAERFRTGSEDDAVFSHTWFYKILVKARWIKPLYAFLELVVEFILNPPCFRASFKPKPKRELNPFYKQLMVWCWNAVLIMTLGLVALFLGEFIVKTISLTEILQVFYLGAITALKVAVLILLASVIWVPIGVWIGLHPKASYIVQPITQFLAAFPINLVYPLVVTGIVYYQLNVEIWTTPLMILGTQWYILFNVIAGATAIPKELRLAAKNLNVKGWLWWKRLALPAIFPYYVTGSMTAAAGTWNASIVADVLEWGNHKLVATGLGSYIVQHTSTGDFPRIALGIAVMCLYVLTINHLIWRKLYQIAIKRFVLG
jgi:NitT/TauT family transport system permease protein